MDLPVVWEGSWGHSLMRLICGHKLPILVPKRASIAHLERCGVSGIYLRLKLRWYVSGRAVAVVKPQSITARKHMRCGSVSAEADGTSIQVRLRIF